MSEPMTQFEHYQRAEELLAKTSYEYDGHTFAFSVEARAAILQEAQVHATLAQTPNHVVNEGWHTSGPKTPPRKYGTEYLTAGRDQ